MALVRIPVIADPKGRNGREFYREHRAEIAKRRRERYATDPAYAEKQRRRARAYYEQFGQRRRRPPADPRPREIVVLGARVRVYTATEVARMLGMTKFLFLIREKQGAVPAATYRTRARWRLYTQDQADLLCATFAEAGGGRSARSRARLRALVHERWARIPKGVGPWREGRAA